MQVNTHASRKKMYALIAGEVNRIKKLTPKHDDVFLQNMRRVTEDDCVMRRRPYTRRI